MDHHNADNANVNNNNNVADKSNYNTKINLTTITNTIPNMSKQVCRSTSTVEERKPQREAF
jgi:hypothetical protein